MDLPVLSALMPVVLLMAVGFAAMRLGWLSAASVKDLSSLSFMVLTPALLFRTMSRVSLTALDFKPLLVYLGVALVLMLSVLLSLGTNRRAAVLALAATFSNTVMIGIPLVGLAYGEAGLLHLLPLIAVHALVLLTLATLVLEFSLQREKSQPGEQPRQLLPTLLATARSAVIHPVPLPIVLGLAFSQTGLQIPPWLDQPLVWLGQAFGPLALLLVGASLARVSIGALWRSALSLALLKSLLHPLLFVAVAWGFGITGLPLLVLTITAALPIGANVFMFSQRYEVAHDLVTAAMALSTLLSLASLTVILLWR